MTVFIIQVCNLFAFQPVRVQRLFAGFRVHVYEWIPCVFACVSPFLVVASCGPLLRKGRGARSQLGSRPDPF